MITIFRRGVTYCWIFLELNQITLNYEHNDDSLRREVTYCWLFLGLCFTYEGVSLHLCQIYHDCPDLKTKQKNYLHQKVWPMTDPSWLSRFNSFYISQEMDWPVLSVSVQGCAGNPPHRLFPTTRSSLFIQIVARRFFANLNICKNVFFAHLNWLNCYKKISELSNISQR